MELETLEMSNSDTRPQTFSSGLILEKKKKRLLIWETLDEEMDTSNIRREESIRNLRIAGKNWGRKNKFWE